MSKKEQVIQELNRVISLIHTDIQAISPAEKKQMVEETVEHFNHYVSPGWLAYRKSVSSDSEAGGRVGVAGRRRLLLWPQWGTVY